MSRLSISFSEPNNEWLNKQVDSKEYSSKSELVNELIRKERKKQEEIEWLRNKIREAEKSGFTELGADEILAVSKSQM